MKVYKVTISDSATYYIKSEDVNNDKELAKDLATEWFDQREPSIEIEEVDCLDDNV